MKNRPHIAVVSPFLDKSFGTERMVVEWISHLADEFEIDIYSQRIQDLDLSKVTWHRIPKISGPHLLNFIWWFAANHVWRAWDRRFHGLRFDLVYTPGINCFDADAITIHIVFAEYVRRLQSELRFMRNSPVSWPRLLHRRLYYRLLILLEARIYTNPLTQLILTSKRTAKELEGFYGRHDLFPVICAGLDHKIFNPARRAFLREEARNKLGLADSRFTILLIGNDWRKKGLMALLDALVLLSELPISLLVASRESASAHRLLFRDKELSDRVVFLSPRPDVEFYYAAADAYVGPSLEDTFALPVAEAMACGLPVIISARAGASDIVAHGVDGLILQDPTDARALASMVRQLYEDPALRARLGGRAAETAGLLTWERSSREIAAIFQDILTKSQDGGADNGLGTLPRGSHTRTT